MTDTRKALISAVASVVVVGLVVGLVLLFALRPAPGYPSLSDQPDPSITGTIAFARWERDGMCISTLPAGGGGEEFEVICDQNIGFGEFTTGWTPDGLLIVEEFRPSGELFRLVDPATGDTVERVPFEMTSVTREPLPIDRFSATFDGLTVEVDGTRGDPHLIIFGKDKTERIVLSEEGPGDYWYDWATWSPDGNWILLNDSEDRLIIVSPTGDPNPRILTDDIDTWMGASWFIEGIEEGTWDPRE